MSEWSGERCIFLNCQSIKVKPSKWVQLPRREIKKKLERSSRKPLYYRFGYRSCGDGHSYVWGQKGFWRLFIN